MTFLDKISAVIWKTTTKVLEISTDRDYTLLYSALSPSWLFDCSRAKTRDPMDPILDTGFLNVPHTKGTLRG